MIRIATAIVLLLLCVTVNAHGELDKRIKELSIKILQDPSNTSLYLERGELYCKQEDYRLSLGDYKVCEERNYLSVRLHLGFARSLRLLKQYELSELYADKILTIQPKHLQALTEKAHSAYGLNEYRRSADLYTAIILHTDKTDIHLYTDACNALEACGTSQCLLEALTLVEKGIEELGNRTILLNKGVKMSLRLKYFDRAQSYQNQLIENIHNKELMSIQNNGHEKRKE